MCARSRCVHSPEPSPSARAADAAVSSDRQAAVNRARLSVACFATKTSVMFACSPYDADATDDASVTARRGSQPWSFGMTFTMLSYLGIVCRRLVYTLHADVKVADNSGLNIFGGGCSNA